MKANQFSISVTIQAIMISFMGTVAIYLITGDHLLVTKSSFIIIWILQVLYLIWYVNKTNRDLDTFLLSMKFLDKVSVAGAGGSFKKLNLTYNQIIDVIRTARKERETEHNYFRSTVEHINTGLISYDDNGSITIFNRAAKEILGSVNFNRIDKLGTIHPDMPGILRSINPGSPRLLTIQNNGRIVRLSINAARLKISGKPVNLISLQDIRNEMEEGELEAWQKLIRILTHEIMNSVTPVQTLTNTMLGQLEKTGQRSVLYQKLNSGLSAIQKRSNGLLAFVNSFRRLNKIPEPEIRPVSTEELFQNITNLMEEELRKRKTELSVDHSEEIIISADKELITQVLINLIRNATEAGAGIIHIGARQEAHGRTVISVQDDGEGISQEDMEKIFIPFYTTKSDGSGIGLSLSRQIMRLHKGSLSVQSVPGRGSTFYLVF